MVFAWGLFSIRLGRADLSAPIIFVTVGLLLAEVLHVIELDLSPEAIKVLAEVTLVWVLFADASRVGWRELRADLGLYARLLGVGLPLTIAAGTFLAVWLFDGMGFWLALLVGAALAPTDAALGASVMTNPAVPERARRVRRRTCVRPLRRPWRGQGGLLRRAELRAASLLTWLVFGAVAVPIVLERVDLPVIGYAVLSLTVVRMLPVALALIGTRLPPPTDRVRPAP